MVIWLSLEVHRCMHFRKSENTIFLSCVSNVFTLAHWHFLVDFVSTVLITTCWTVYSLCPIFLTHRHKRQCFVVWQQHSALVKFTLSQLSLVITCTLPPAKVGEFSSLTNKFVQSLSRDYTSHGFGYHLICLLIYSPFTICEDEVRQLLHSGYINGTILLPVSSYISSGTHPVFSCSQLEITHYYRSKCSHRYPTPSVLVGRGLAGLLPFGLQRDFYQEAIFGFFIGIYFRNAELQLLTRHE